MNLKVIFFISSAMVIMMIAGCDNGGPDWERVEKLRDENSSLRRQVKELQITNTSLNKQIETLSELDKDVRLEAVSTLDKIELTGRTGIYDRDGDGEYESLIVYIRPYDIAGDVVKTSGSVELQLWNLDAGPEGALLAEWKITPEQLRKKWMGMLMTNYYRIIEDISDVVQDPTEDFTVKVKFTDYLTGKVHNKQMMITGKTR